MTEQTPPVDHSEPSSVEEPAEPGPGLEPAEPVEPTPGGVPPRRRVRRRAERPGTNPSAEDVPDVVPPRDEPKPGESQHDRWLREQRPPHWE